MKKITIVCVFLLVLIVFPVFAERIAMPRVVMPSAASNGFGGHHVAYTDNVYSLLVNPAAMVRVQQRSLLTVAPSLFNPGRMVSIGRPIIDVVNLARKDSSDTSAILDAAGDILKNLSDKDGRIGLGAELREFPLSFSSVNNGFGIGLWNRFFFNVNVLELNYEVDAFADVMLPFGFAFKILDMGNHAIDAGFTIKPFARVMIHERDSITNVIDNSDEFLDNINVPLIMGATFDVGVLYRLKGLRLGFTFNDIFSRAVVVNNLVGKNTNSYYFPFTMNAGLAFDVKLAFFGLALAADWRDIGNIFQPDDYSARNAILDLGVGLQVSLFDFVYARIGMSEMLPAAGVGLYLGALKIDLAYYGKEFGLQPGDFSTAVFEASISVRPDAKPKNRSWTRSYIGSSSASGGYE